MAELLCGRIYITYSTAHELHMILNEPPQSTSHSYANVYGILYIAEKIGGNKIWQIVPELNICGFYFGDCLPRTLYSSTDALWLWGRSKRACEIMYGTAIGVLRTAACVH